VITRPLYGDHTPPPTPGDPYSQAMPPPPPPSGGPRVTEAPFTPCKSRITPIDSTVGSIPSLASIFRRTSSPFRRRYDLNHRPTLCSNSDKKWEPNKNY